MSDDMKILVCLGAHNKWYGRFIRWVLRYPYNHAFIIYQSADWGRWMALEVLDKVAILPADFALRRYCAVKMYECSRDLTLGLRSIIGYVGTDREFLGVFIGLLKIILWKWFGLRWVRPFHRTAQLFCTECVALVLKNSNIPQTTGWEPSNVSPVALGDFWASSPDFSETSI